MLKVTNLVGDRARVLTPDSRGAHPGAACLGQFDPEDKTVSQLTSLVLWNWFRIGPPVGGNAGLQTRPAYLPASLTGLRVLLPNC